MSQLPIYDSAYQTNGWRLIAAYLAGSIIAGATFVLGFGILILRGERISDANPWSWDELQGVFILWLVISITWLIGQVSLISIPWILLHNTGKRHWKYAVGLGLVVVPVASFLLPIQIRWGILPIALWGGIMGWVIWRIAYFKDGPEGNA